jgi:prophage regulatory protein
MATDRLGTFLTAEAIAEKLGVSTRTLWRWIQEKIFPKPIKIGRSTRWLESDVVAYIDRLRGKQAKA